MLPKNRSNSIRKIKRRTPAKRISIIFKRRKKTKKHYSPISHKLLNATNSDPTVAKSKRRPNRPFGGMLTSQESRQVIKYRELLNSKKIEEKDIPLKYRSFVLNKK